MTELDNNEAQVNNEPIASPIGDEPPVTDQEIAQAPAAAEETPVEQKAEAAPEVDENDFAAAYEKTLVSIRAGQIIKGTVVQVSDDEICVNIGYKSDGYVSKDEMSADPDVVLSEMVKVGDEIEVEVVKLNDGQGNVQLSKKRVDARKVWNEFMQNAKEGDTYIEVQGKKAVKGGLLAYAADTDTQVFIPASQLATRYVEHIDSFVGKTMMVKVLEVDEDKKRVVGSRKQVLIEEAAQKKEKIWAKIQVGAHLQGIVRRLTDFGAFVDIGGTDGMIHVSDLAWSRVRHPSDVLKVNDEIEVVVLAADPEKERISLGYKQLQPKPWDLAEQKYPVGSIVQGKVARIVSFGAIVELEPGIDGLVHISQISRQRIEKVEDVLQPGQVVDVKVLNVDVERQRISLSIREALAAEEQPMQDYQGEDDDISFTVPEIDDIGGVTIGDILSNQNIEFPVAEEENTEE